MKTNWYVTEDVENYMYGCCCILLAILLPCIFCGCKIVIIWGEEWVIICIGYVSMLTLERQQRHGRNA